jgi:glycosyltransferase involved in cell wall biosynthesis
MLVGLPVVALATTEMVTVVENGVSGYLHTDPDRLAQAMRRLLEDPAEAHALGQAARRAAAQRFDIARFAVDWDRVLHEVCG